MKYFKLLLPIFIICIVFTACKEKGEIEKLNKEVYYLKTSYNDQVFILLDQINEGSSKRVVFSTEETLPEDSSEIKPGTYICETMTKDEFEDLTAGYNLFEADLDVITAIDPATGKVYTCISDGNTEADLRKALSREYSYEIPKEKVTTYIEENKLNYFKL